MAADNIFEIMHFTQGLFSGRGSNMGTVTPPAKQFKAYLYQRRCLTISLLNQRPIRRRLFRRDHHCCCHSVSCLQVQQTHALRGAAGFADGA